VNRRKQITQEELNEVVRLHKLWLSKNPEGKRAEFCGLGLTNIEIINADLRYADFTMAFLHDVNLSGSNLFKCQFFKASLWNVNLLNTNLQRCRFDKAYLDDTDFTVANLKNAHLDGIKVRNCNGIKTFNLGKDICYIWKNQIQIAWDIYPYKQWLEGNRFRKFAKMCKYTDEEIEGYLKVMGVIIGDNNVIQ
jgi:hypothetical protein